VQLLETPLGMASSDCVEVPYTQHERKSGSH
jgi:hypothetical protein